MFIEQPIDKQFHNLVGHTCQEDIKLIGEVAYSLTYLRQFCKEILTIAGSHRLHQSPDTCLGFSLECKFDYLVVVEIHDDRSVLIYQHIQRTATCGLYLHVSVGQQDGRCQSCGATDSEALGIFL